MTTPISREHLDVLERLERFGCVLTARDHARILLYHARNQNESVQIMDTDTETPLETLDEITLSIKLCGEVFVRPIPN